MPFFLEPNTMLLAELFFVIGLDLNQDKNIKQELI